MEPIVELPLDFAVRDLVTVYEEDFFKTSGYKKMKRLGGGFTSVVALCNPRDGSSWKALKMLSKMLKHDGKLNKGCFEAEVAALSEMKHKNIAEMFGAFEAPDMYIISMKHYPGGDLKTHLPTLENDQIPVIFLEITSAVHYLHSARMAHRDIKPENVLIASDGRAVLVDFGLAIRITSDEEPLLERCGTVAYSAPEMLTTPKNSLINYAKLDMYGLGLLLWCMEVRQESEEELDHLECYIHPCSIPGSYYHLIENLIRPVVQDRWDCRQLETELWDSWTPMGWDLTQYFPDPRRNPEPQMTSDASLPEEIVASFESLTSEDKPET